MERVTRSGGWIVVLDPDFSSLSFDTAEFEIEQRLKCFRIDHLGHNALAGRQLYRLFNQQNLGDISVEMCPTYVTDMALARKAAGMDTVEQEALAAGYVTTDEVQCWRRSLEQADADGVFFCTINQVMVAGRKP